MTRIELDLSRHCIATEVKRLHSRRISDYFKCRGEKAALEAEISLLTRALDELDLASLRGLHRLLAGGEPAKAVLSAEPDRPLSITLEGASLDLEGYRRE